MRAEQLSWESYFYPETIDPVTGNGTLRNLLGLSDAGELRAAAFGHTIDRQMELLEGSANTPHTFDADHIKAIHQHLFQDVYGWAGEYRFVDIAKGRPFALVGEGEIDRALNAASQTIKETSWSSVTREEFGDRMGEIFTQVNHAHPFR